jgi:predicted N-formylglutamate amidohydrolase
LQGLAERDVRAAESDSVAVENADGAGAYVILCDHASNRFPPEFGDLGLAAADREAHVAWDPGALGVSRHLSARLDAPLVYPTVSRLVIDCNRAFDAPNLIAAISERTIVPGNARITEAERRRRIAAVHEPYHAAIEALVERRLAVGHDTALIAVHSFTPIYDGVARPWHVGILFDRDRRLADRLIAQLSADCLTVGVNEPYSPADGVYYTLSRHAESRGLACVMVEIRNDLLAGAAEERDWAARLAAPLERGGAGA